MKKQVLKNSIGNFLLKSGQKITGTKEGLSALSYVLEKSDHFLVSLQIYNILKGEKSEGEVKKLFQDHLAKKFGQSISNIERKKELLWFKDVLDGEIQVPDFLHPEVLRYAGVFYSEILKKEVFGSYKLR